MEVKIPKINLLHINPNLLKLGMQDPLENFILTPTHFNFDLSEVIGGKNNFGLEGTNRLPPNSSNLLET